MHAATFEQYRALLFSIAYRMLGTAMEAEDIVQDVYLRYSQVDYDSIDSHKHYLTTIVTRLSINKMNSAQAQREQYTGTWLPEPIITANQPNLLNPSERASRLDTISMAFLVLLEKLSASERAVFLLREVFDYDYAEIANIVEKNENACRKLFSRAKKHLQDNRPRFESDPQQHETMLKGFVQAIEGGQLDTLVSMLADDAVLLADGGKRRGAATRPIFGAMNAAKFMMGIKRLYNPSDFDMTFEMLNGKPSLLLYLEEELYVVISVEIANGKVHQIHLLSNEDKLKNL